MAAWQQPPLPGMGNVHRSALAHERKHGQNLQPMQFYHGTDVPGLRQVVPPSKGGQEQAYNQTGEEGYVFATPHYSTAVAYAESGHRTGLKPRVYKVQATGPVEANDFGDPETEVRSKHPFKVIGEMGWGRD